MLFHKRFTRPVIKAPVLNFKTQRPVIFTYPGGTIDGPSTIFASIDQLKTYLIECSRWECSAEDIVFDAEPSCDERVGWKDKRKVYIKRLGDQIYKYPQVWGYCATRFPKQLKAYRDGYVASQRTSDKMLDMRRKEKDDLLKLIWQYKKKIKQLEAKHAQH